MSTLRRARDRWKELESLAPEDRRRLLEEIGQTEPEVRAAVERMAACPEEYLEEVSIGHLGLRDADGASPQDMSPRLAPIESDPEALIGRRFRGYEIVEILGVGGGGVVYRARQTEPVRRDVAIKFLVLSPLTLDAAIARFEVECQLLAKLSHPHIAKMFDSGREEGRPFLVMEYVPGLPLVLFCETRRLDLRDRLRLFLDLCDAVQHAHRNQVLHRDIKPSNVIVHERGDPLRPHVSLIDFGIAKDLDHSTSVEHSIAGQGRPFGTYCYMSPEQTGAIAAAIDTRSDIYSLGAVLYALLTGVPPLDLDDGMSDSEIVATIVGADPVRPSTRRAGLHTTGKPPCDLSPRRIRGDLDWIVMKCLEKEPDRRYASASELASDIERFLSHQVVHARPPSAGYRIGRFLHRYPWQSVASVLLLLVIVAAVAVTMISAAHESERVAHEREKAARRWALMRQYASANFAAEAAIQDHDASQAAEYLGADRSYDALGYSSPCFERRYLRAQTNVATSVHQIGHSLTGIAEFLERPDGSRWIVAPRGAHLLLVPLVGGGDPITRRLWPDEDRVLGPVSVDARMHALAVSSRSSRPDGDSGGNRVSVIPIESVLDGSLSGQRSWDIEATRVARLAFRPGAPFLLVASNEGIVLWRTDDTRNPPRQLVIPAADIGQLATSADGRWLGVPLMYEQVIAIWDLSRLTAEFETGATESTSGPDIVLAGHADNVEGVSFDDQASLAASSSLDGTIRLWDLERSVDQAPADGVLLGELGTQDGPGMTGVIFAGRNRIIAGCADGTVRQWSFTLRGDGAFGRRLHSRAHEILHRHGDGVRRVWADSDGRTILSLDQDGEIRSWNALHEQHARLTGHTSSVYAAEFPIDGRAYSIDAKGGLIAWDIARAVALARAQMQGYGLPGGLAASSQAVATLGQDDHGVATVELWDTTSERLLTQSLAWRVPRAVGDATGSLALSNNAERLAVGMSNGRVVVWNAGNPHTPVLEIQPTEYPIRKLLFWDDGGDLLLWADGHHWADQAVDGEGHLGIISVGEGRNCFKTLGHHGGVVDLDLRRVDRLLASVGRDGVLRLWTIDPVRASLSRRAQTAASTSRLTAVSIHPNEPRIATASVNRLIKLWSTRDILGDDTLLCVAALHGHIGAISSVAFSPDGNVLASASMGLLGTDNSVWLWDGYAEDQVMQVRSDRQYSRAAARQLQEWAETGLTEEEVDRRVAEAGRMVPELGRELERQRAEWTREQ